MSGQNAALAPINGEVVPPGEPAATQEIVRLVENKIREAAKSGPAMRDAHPKGHGCVRASFRILDDLPAGLRVGLFAEPRTYDAWIRYSNGSPTPQADSKGDGRGMAIKLMGVPDSPSTTQDFILINHPVFAVRNVVDYLELERSSPFWRFFLPGFNPFRARVHEALVARAILGKKVNNLLNIRYWSMSPYRFGDSACKYSARPVGPESPYADTADANFLRANLVRHLAQRDAEFEFMVQPRRQPDTMPIEDATIEWDETAAPFVPVARITIPKQSFDSPEQMKFCENLSFTPWHCVDVHRPLGGLNRLRRVTYDAISRLRHDLNHAPRREPVDFTIG
jgi:catalase